MKKGYVHIEKQLHDKLKILAIKQGKTLTELVSENLSKLVK